MRVLYVVRGLNQSSGTTHAIIPMAEEMARRSHEVWLYAVRKPAGTVEAVPDPALVKTRMFDMSLPLNHPGFSLSFAKAIRQEIRGFDIVHIQAVRNFVTWWTMRCAREAGVAYIVAPQGSYDPWVLAQRSRINRLWDRWLEIPLLNRAARIQCLTKREVGQVRAMGITAECVVIPNGVETQRSEVIRLRSESPASQGSQRSEVGNQESGVRGQQLDNLTTQQLGNLATEEKAKARRILAIPADTAVILFLGRVHPKKGLDVLIRAFARLQVSGDKCQVSGAIGQDDATSVSIVPSSVVCPPSSPFLLIAGSDGGSGYRTELKRLVEQEGIAGQTRWLGEVRGEAKGQALAAADVFCLPSYSEGLPVAVLEAMAVGLPVVVSDACNLPEVAEWNAGVVVRGQLSVISDQSSVISDDGRRTTDDGRQKSGERRAESGGRTDDGQAREQSSIFNLQSSMLAGAITRVLGGAHICAQMGKNARRLAEDKFAWVTVVQQTSSCYEEILKQGDRSIQ